MPEFYAVASANQQDVELVLTVNDDVRYCETRLNHRAALGFAMQELLEENVFVAAQSVGQDC